MKNTVTLTQTRDTGAQIVSVRDTEQTLHAVFQAGDYLATKAHERKDRIKRLEEHIRILVIVLGIVSLVAVLGGIG